jgi:hypothetical protein
MSKLRLKSDEILVRVIFRRAKDTARPSMDELDFNRRERFAGLDKPENGLSLLRRAVLSLNEMYEYVGSPYKLKGAAECQLSKLESLSLNYIVTGKKNEHVSLRCHICNMAESPATCCPKDGSDCPMFRNDKYSLTKTFRLIEVATKQHI